MSLRISKNNSKIINSNMKLNLNKISRINSKLTNYNNKYNPNLNKLKTNY